jgi:hypothetical protein
LTGRQAKIGKIKKKDKKKGLTLVREGLSIIGGRRRRASRPPASSSSATTKLPLPLQITATTNTESTLKPTEGHYTPNALAPAFPVDRGWAGIIGQARAGELIRPCLAARNNLQQGSRGGGQAGKGKVRVREGVLQIAR